MVERETSWDQTGAGIYLPGNAVRALRMLGLESAVMERAAPIPRQRICDHRGRLLSDIDLSPLWGGVGACVALHRADLHEVLASYGDGVRVRMGLPVRRLQQRGEKVTVEFGDGTTDEYDLVVGADGVHSTVRDLTFGASAVKPLGQRAWRFVTRCPADVDTWSVFLGRAVSFLAIPIGRGRVYCYCDAPEHVGAGATRGPAIEDLARLLTDFAGPVPAVLDSLGPETAVHVGSIEEVSLDRWRSGSVLLIGDAAHATSPNMAEGAAMALEDGLVLAECLGTGRADPPGVGELRSTSSIHARTGFGPRPIAGTAPAACRRSCAMRCCARGAGRSSITTTVPFCSLRNRRGSPG